MITGTEEVPPEFGPYWNELWKCFNGKGVYAEEDDDESIKPMESVKPPENRPYKESSSPTIES